VLKPLRTENPPRIDGKLDDEVWHNAPSLTGFKTYVPDFGVEMEKTIAYYAYDRENLYFAFRCYDSEPKKIKTSISSRDNIKSDDWICINLDSFNDQQALYGFYVNPMGIQTDSRYAGKVDDLSFDMVWYSKGVIDESGYTVEVQIPFKSIRFSQDDPVEMGVAFERKITRKSQQGTVPPLDPQQGMSFLTQMQPMVLYNIKHYKLVELLPSITRGKKSFHTGGKMLSEGAEGDISLTTKYGITSDMVLDGTYNPDFSQVEADAGQVDVNLRYALFYPEKRPFFLEGRENFDFAGSSASDPLKNIVHTRMIVNPLVGIKLSGKLGEKNIIASINAIDELEERSTPGTEDGKYAHFSIFRYKRKLSEDSYIGGMYTGRDINSGYNRVIGSDGRIRINESSLFGFHGFFSFDREGGKSTGIQGHAAGCDYNYRIRRINVSFGFQDISEDFQTKTGYVTRTGISRLRASVSPNFFPDSEILRRVTPGISREHTDDKLSEIYETNTTIFMNFTLRRSSNIMLSYENSTEVYLAEKFDTGGLRISTRSQLTKQFYFNLSYRKGKAIRYAQDPYQGKGSSSSLSIIYQPSAKLNTDIRFTYYDFYKDLNDEKIYEYTILRNKLTYQFNRYLFFRGIVEYNSYRKKLLTDFLASFTYIPGTVIHFGYGSIYERVRWDESLQQPQYIPHDAFLETQRGFFFKASYLWRM